MLEAEQGWAKVFFFLWAGLKILNYAAWSATYQKLLLQLHNESSENGMVMHT